MGRGWEQKSGGKGVDAKYFTVSSSSSRLVHNLLARVKFHKRPNKHKYEYSNPRRQTLYNSTNMRLLMVSRRAPRTQNGIEQKVIKCSARILLGVGTNLKEGSRKWEAAHVQHKAPEKNFVVPHQFFWLYKCN